MVWKVFEAMSVVAISYASTPKLKKPYTFIIFELGE